MKNILLILVLVPVMGFAQNVTLQKDTATGKVVFRHVMEFDSVYTSDALYGIVKEWLSSDISKFNISNSEKNANATNVLLGVKTGNSAPVEALYKNDQPLRMQDEAAKKMIGRGVIKYMGSNLGCLRKTYWEFDIKISIKNGKIKSEITNFTYTHYNQVSMQQVQIYGWSDKGPCGSKGELEMLMQCHECPNDLSKLYDFIINSSKDLQVSLNSFVLKSKPDIEDW